MASPPGPSSPRVLFLCYSCAIPASAFPNYFLSRGFSDCQHSHGGFPEEVVTDLDPGVHEALL